MLTAIDGELDRLRLAAGFAEAERGRAHSDTLMQYHAQLDALLTRAFAELRLADDPTLTKRDRAGHQAHALAIGTAIRDDLNALHARYMRMLERHEVTRPGARGVVEAYVNRGVAAGYMWWDGKLPLGPLTSPIVAARDWRAYRPLPAWIAWATGGGAVVAVAVPTLSIIFLH